MGLIDINGTEWPIYGTDEGADEYLAAALHAGTTWASASETTRAQALVTATRMLDRQTWAVEFTHEDAPEAIVMACYELALALLEDAAVQSNATAGQNISSVRAGPVAVTFFRPEDAGRFPTIVQELVGPYLAGSSPALSARAGDTSATSQFDDCDTFKVG